MIATASPASYNYDETMGTLRYANRTKQIKNKPKVNEDPKDTMLREYQEEIARLKAQLEGLESGEGDVLNGADDASNEDEEDDDDSNSEEANSSPSKKRQARKQGTSTAATQRTRRNSETRQLSEQKIRELQESIDRERQALLQSQDATEAEKQKTLQALQQREAELEWERQARETLAQKLAAMQAKLLVGDGTETILDQAEKHARELQRQAAELEERRRAEEELQHGLDEQEELHFQIEESYTSLQEEAAEKTRKLKQLWTMLMRHKSEINDMEEQFYREKEQLLDAVNDLSNELKMKTLIVDTYIPADYQQVIESKAMYDAEMDKWTIEHAAESAARHQEQLQQRRSERRASKDAAHNPFVGLYSNPLVLFPDMYLSYDMFVAATNAMASGSSPRKASRTSMSRASPTKTTTARRLSSAVAESETASIDAAPMPRGLVVNAKRYA